MELFDHTVVITQLSPQRLSWSWSYGLLMQSVPITTNM